MFSVQRWSASRYALHQLVTEWLAEGEREGTFAVYSYEVDVELETDA